MGGRSGERMRFRQALREALGHCAPHREAALEALVHFAVGGQGGKLALPDRDQILRICR